MADLVGQHLGNYEIEALLGIGGMASVYQARPLNIDRKVAIKVINPELATTEDFKKRFEREAQAIASLTHPHILKLFEYGQDQGRAYLVTELLPGGDLAGLLSRGALPLDTIDHILSQIASALSYAHRKGIIHRDLKPHNVLLDEDGNVYLTDFGIAKLLNRTAMTGTGLAMGTPLYMAPEQWQGKPLDARTDIYSLGIMLFEMLTGQLPFRADTPFALMHQHIYEPPPPVRSLKADVPEAVEGVVNKAIAKAPDERFGSANEVSVAFKQALVTPADRSIPTTSAQPEMQAAAPYSPTQAAPVKTEPQIQLVPRQEAAHRQPSAARFRVPLGPLTGGLILLLALASGGLLLSQINRASLISALPTDMSVPTLPTNTSIPSVTATAPSTVTPTPTESPVSSDTLEPSDTALPTETATVAVAAIQSTVTATSNSQTRTALAKLPTATPTWTEGPPPTITVNPLIFTYTPTPRRTRTPIPTRTLTPTATVPASKPYRIITRIPVDAYSCPRTNCWVVVAIGTGQIVNVVDTVEGSTVPGRQGTKWYKITYNGKFVYVHSSHLEPVEQTATLSAFPTEIRTQLYIAQQDFEHGYMFWISTAKVIWVLYYGPGDNSKSGEWQSHPDTFVDGEPELDPNLNPPDNTGKQLYQPKRDFGKLWRTTPEVRNVLGWATTPEFGLNTSYVYQAGGYLDSNNKYVARPGKHYITTLSRQTFAITEPEPPNVRGTWEIVS